MTGPKRSPLAPEVPTMIEAGVPGFEISAWYMLFAPTKTPKDVMREAQPRGQRGDRGSRSVAQALARKASNSPAARPSRPTRSCTSEIDRWGEVIKAAGIKAE